MKNRLIYMFIAIDLFVMIMAGTFYILYKNRQDRNENNAADLSITATPTQAESREETELDLTKLPLGDNKYSNSPKVGYVYSCQTTFNGGGAFAQGPWIDNENKTWDWTKKITVDGDVAWSNAKMNVTISGTKRILSGNGLPSHSTGVYPITSSDDAYQYDRNPNSIKEQTLSMELTANPTPLATPECAGGQVGIMLTGAPLFNAFDAGGRDAVATEIQDKCGGHPEKTGQYHYHGNSECLYDDSSNDSHSELVGYALDGFGIFGAKGENGKYLSSNDLDICHGHTHEIIWDGKNVEMFHYHLTSDFPYSVGCFRGKSIKVAPPQMETNSQTPPPRRM